MSSSQTIKSGVPQGYALGPAVFLILINEMLLQTDTDIYADDTINHTAGEKLEVVEPRLQMSAGDFNTWCIDNNMAVHYNKTHSFVVCSKH